MYNLVERARPVVYNPPIVKGVPMATDLLERPVAKKPDTTLRADAETADVIRKASSLKGMSIVEYLRVVVLPIARRDLMAEAKKLTKGEKPE
jgi:hypothetical protein